MWRSETNSSIWPAKTVNQPWLATPLSQHLYDDHSGQQSTCGSAANASKARDAVIGSAKMLRSIANVRFGEAAPQRHNRLRMAGLGRSLGPTPWAES